MQKMIVFILLTLFPELLFAADPIISSVTGSCVHDGTITINGSNFGSKSPAAPLMWDNCENRTLNDVDEPEKSGGTSSSWSDVVPGDTYGTTWRPKYVTSDGTYRNVSAVHQYSEAHIAGGHQYTGKEGNPANVVMLVKLAGSASWSWYSHSYRQYDPLWPSPCQSGENHKWHRHGVAEENGPYLQWSDGTGAGPPCYKICSHESTICSKMVHWANFPPFGSCDWEWYHDPVDSAGPTLYAQWTAVETVWNPNAGILRVSLDNTPIIGWYDSMAPNCVGYHNSQEIRIEIGGYWRDHDPGGVTDDDAFRHWDDIYIDTTLARVVLGNNAIYDSCTIIEPQIPSAWDTNSITCTVNLGKLTGENAYLFVFDSSNNTNPIGYAVALGVSTIETITIEGGKIEP